MALIKYTSRIVPTTADGVLVETTYIKDEDQGKLQSEINADLYRRLNNLGSSTTYKGSLESYTDLPENASPGDVYGIKTSVTLADKTYPPGSTWIWSSSGGWEPYGTASTEYTDGRLQEVREEFIGKLKTSKEEILEEAKSYTDNQLENFLAWIEPDEE